MKPRPLFLFLLLTLFSSLSQAKSSYSWLDTYEHDLKNLVKTYPTTLSVSCILSVIKQVNYLKNETYSQQFTFEKYKIENFSLKNQKPLANLDLKNSPKSARMFRTLIQNQLSTEGPNFASYYSIVSVSMTGAPKLYWIIDRRDGKAYELPYMSALGSLNFRIDSNLIILDPKEEILSNFESKDDQEEYSVIACHPGGSGTIDIFLKDARPFYLLWKNNKITILAPKNFNPKKQIY